MITPSPYMDWRLIDAIDRENSRSYLREVCCPFCSNWYRGDEVRVAIDYCSGCRGNGATALRNQTMVERYLEWVREQVKAGEPIDTEKVRQINRVLRGGYLSGEFAALLRIAQAGVHSDE